MIIISWNTQGAKKLQVVQEVQFLSKMFKADMIFLLETMVNDKNKLKILPQMGFEHFEYVAPTNHSGGIAVLWKNGKTHISPILKESRAIHMLVHDPERASNSIIYGVCALAQAIDKYRF